MTALIAVSLSGFELAAGARVSQLDNVGFPEPSPRADVTADFIIFVLALLGLVAGEWLAQQTVPLFSEARNRTRALARQAPRFESKGVYAVLVAMAVLSFVLSGHETLQQSLQSRGQVTGQGPRQLLGYAPALAVVVGVICSHWRSRLLLGVSVALTLGTLLSGGTRTPLAIIGVAVLIKLIIDSTSTRHPVALGAGLVLLGYVGLVLFVAVSAWRGSVATGYPVSLGSEIVQVARDPIAGLTPGGLDTVDGLSLATKVNRAQVGATVLDPLKAIVEFVPRQLWPNKPEFLGNIVSRDYTDFGGNSGMFLSGPGYALIVFGGRLAMMLAFAVIGFVAEAIYRRQSRLTVWTVMVTYFLVRFTVAGDAFDLFHVLGLCLLFCVAYASYRITDREWRAYVIHRAATLGQQKVQAGASR